jgi:5'-deoxynucleotidase YfbR-like HD superfamily hydrolase
VAEHTFLVAHYANDLCVFLGVSTDIHLATLQMALWHDAKDEIFTGDLPGPNKRALLEAIGPDAKKRWNEKLSQWVNQTFRAYFFRSGGHTAHTNSTSEVVELIIKTADWLEASVKMATEVQLGNHCAERHIWPNLNGSLETAVKLIEHLTGERVAPGEVPLVPNKAYQTYTELESMLRHSVDQALRGHSIGPWVTREDESRL